MFIILTGKIIKYNHRKSQTVLCHSDFSFVDYCHNADDFQADMLSTAVCNFYIKRKRNKLPPNKQVNKNSFTISSLNFP